MYGTYAWYECMFSLVVTIICCWMFLSITFNVKTHDHGHPNVDGTMMEEGMLPSPYLNSLSDPDCESMPGPLRYGHNTPDNNARS